MPIISLAMLQLFVRDEDMMATVADVVKQLPESRYGWIIYHHMEKLNKEDLLADLGICSETTLMASSSPSWVFDNDDEIYAAVKHTSQSAGEYQKILMVKSMLLVVPMS